MDRGTRLFPSCFRHWTISEIEDLPDVLIPATNQAQGLCQAFIIFCQTYCKERKGPAENSPATA